MTSLLLVCPTAVDPALGVAQVALELASGLARAGIPADVVEGWKGASSFTALRSRLAALHAGLRAGQLLECPAPWAAALPRGGAPVYHRSTQPDLAYLRAEAQGQGTRAWLHAAASALPVMAGWRRVDGFLALGEDEAAWMRGHVPWLAPRLQAYLHAPPRELRPVLRDLASRRAAPAAGATRWLWMGRWVAHKGTASLVSFLEGRLSRHPGEVATLAGTGAVPRLPASLRGRVRVVPRFGRGELPGLLAGHDAGLFTSITEGWGLSLQEMLESGLPVYATQAGGVQDLAPWFPGSLRPFPPVEGDVAPSAPPRPGYFERFDWDAISADVASWLRTLSG